MLGRVLRYAVWPLSLVSRLQHSAARRLQLELRLGVCACVSDRVKPCLQLPSASLPPSYVATLLPPLTILP